MDAVCVYENNINHISQGMTLYDSAAPEQTLNCRRDLFVDKLKFYCLKAAQMLPIFKRFFFFQNWSHCLLLYKQWQAAENTAGEIQRQTNSCLRPIKVTG